MDDYIAVAGRTTDVDEAEQLIRGNTGVFSVAPGGGGPFFFDLARGGDRRGLVSGFTYGAAFETESVHDVFTVASIAVGEMRWAMGDERGTQADGPFLQVPGVPMWTAGDTVSAVGTYLPRWFLQETACRSYAVDHFDLRFDSPWPEDRALGQHWLRLTALASESRDAGTLESDLLRSAVLSSLAVGVLECFRLVDRPEVRSAGMGLERKRFRAAARYFEDFASLPITPGDAADELGVPLRELHRAFRYAAGTSATAYLRRVRLSCAHDDLRAADAATVSVDRIALRWGFASPRTFAQAYRREYGVDPGTVLGS